MRPRSLFATILLATVLAGCGGGGATEGAGSTQVQTFDGYGIKATYQGKGSVTPLVQGSNANGAAFTGLFGVSFTAVQTNQVPTLSNTKIAFSRNGNLWTVSPDLSNETPVTKGFRVDTNVAYPAIHPNGRVAAIIHYDPVTHIEQLYFAALDGSSLTRETSGLHSPYGPAWNPGGTVCIFTMYDGQSGHYQIFSIPSGGGTPTRLSDGTGEDSYPQYTRDGTKIYFFRELGTTFNLFSMNANGTNQINLNFWNTSAGVAGLALSPDGTTATFSDRTQMWQVSLQSGNSTSYIPPGSDTFQYPTYSPDGRYILFADINGPTSMLARMNFDMTGFHDLTDGSLPYTTPNWGPFPQNHQVIGPSGNLATGASGFLFGQLGGTITSFVAFTTTTPSTANIVAQAQTNSNSVFQLKGDSITKLAFMNDISTSATTVLPVTGLSSAGGALVSFDSTTGIVVSVIPFSPGTPKMAPMKKGNILFYSGKFFGIWNGSGKNVAPEGAKTVEINASTGAVLAFS